MVIYNLKDKQIIKINVNSFLCTEKKIKKKKKVKWGSTEQGIEVYFLR